MYDKLRKIREERAAEDRGFTLIELLVVVVIIGILVAIAIPLYLNYQRGAHDRSAQSDLRGAIPALQQCFSENNNQFPTTGFTGVGKGDPALTLTCGTDSEVIKLSDQSFMTYTPTATGSSYTLAVWNTGGKSHKDAGSAYTYDSSAGGTVGP
jgi:type IV pilus assembly protein PilA